MKSPAPLGLIVLIGASFGVGACANNEGSSASMNDRTSSTHTAPNAADDATPLASYDSLQRDAARVGDLFTIPTFETTTEQIVANVDKTLAKADRGLDALAGQEPSSATFKSTIVDLDDINYPVFNITNRMFLVKETSTDPSIREVATRQVQRLQDWFTQTQYREDVYKSCKAFQQAYKAGRRGRLFGEDLKLFDETMRDYRRAGLELDAATRAKVEALQKQLTALSTEFDTNITNADVTVYFTRDELEGVPEPLLEQAKSQGKTEKKVKLYGIKATVTPQYISAMQTLKREDARKRLLAARFSVMEEENTPILDELIQVRDQIAHLLGYNSWDNYQIEPKMAKTGAKALAFLTDLKNGLEPKFQAELEEFASLKRAETGDADAVINLWDWRYYANELKKQKYDIDTEALRVYFPLDRTLAGMFGVYEEIFGIKIQPMAAPWVWSEGVTLHAVSDADTGEPLGMFYLDLFPRKGKYNHFAQFDITGGKLLPEGLYQRPVCALVGNFTPARGDTPSLLEHSEVVTMFHEFGHVMHTILTHARYGRFAGTNVPRDFVEAPSQMLEQWAWSPPVLDRFAADYRDESKKIDPAVVAHMKEAKLATIGTIYRRQLAFGFADLWMHDAGEYKSSQEIFNKAEADIFLPAPPQTNMAAYWGHMTGYDAGYYGYAWAASIAADLATAFKDSPDGFLSKEIGRRLRNEIYASGGGRDVEKSIRAFLGRERSIKPFFKELGIKSEDRR